MASSYWTAAVALGFLIACNHAPPDGSAQPSGGIPDGGSGDDASPGGDAGPGSDAGSGSDADSGSGPAACPVGVATWTRAIGLSGTSQRSDVAVDTAGNVLFATDGPASPGAADGVTKLSPSGDVLLTRPWGSVVTMDRAGHAYVAGSFTEPLDVGLGVMQPQGNIDVFVAELDADGAVVFARALGLCGDGVRSIAVDTTGRIAVSGTAMGTAVLAPNGDLLFALALSGSVAFTSHGDLVIAGDFTATIDLGDGPIDAGQDTEGFVIEVDGAGHRRWSHLLAGHGVHTTGVAVDTLDRVVLVGYYEGSIMLFGEEFRAISAGESGRVTGAYLAKLDAGGALMWKIGRAGGSEANGVATDASANVIMSGAFTGNAGFSRITSLSKFDPGGLALGGSSMFPASGYGRGFGVAADACGSIYMTAVALDTANSLSPVRAYVVKLAP